MKNKIINEPLPTREDFMIDAALFDYYNKNFNISKNIHSIPKLKMIQSIHEYKQKQQNRILWLSLTSTSVAVLILLSGYVSVNFIKESNIEKQIQIID